MDIAGPTLEHLSCVCLIMVSNNVMVDVGDTAYNRSNRLAGAQVSERLYVPLHLCLVLSSQSRGQVTLVVLFVLVYIQKTLGTYFDLA
jgi:hypothetical protein